MSRLPSPPVWWTTPRRAAAPLVSLTGRMLAADWWTGSETRLDDAGPPVVVGSEPDVQGPRDGAGPLNERRYRILIRGARLGPDELIARFASDANAFSPTAYALFATDDPSAELVEGARAEVHLPGPWNGPVIVRRRTDRRLRLETLDGHMEAGWIEFGAEPDGELLAFTIESRARSGDPAFDALYHRLGLGRLVQSLMWVQVLEAGARISGGRQVGRVTVDTTVHRGAAP